MFTINGSHMIYGFSDMECNRQNVLSTWTVFCPFTLPLPPNNPENQNFEKLKKAPRAIILFHKCTKIHDHMLYYSLEMARNRFNCYLLFWAIFHPFSSLPNSSKTQNLEKLRKTPGDIMILQ